MVLGYSEPYFETCCGDDEDILGPRHTAASSKALAGLKALPQPRIPKFISEAVLNKGLDKWLARPKDPQAVNRGAIKDSVFVYVRELLMEYGKGEWSLRPRTFAILRMMGCPEALDEFIALKRTDAFLPYTDQNLPYVIKGSARFKFLKLQRLVMCNRPDISELENGGKHLHFKNMGDTYFETRNKLGQGSHGIVQRIINRQSLRTYARKLIHRGATVLEDSNKCRQFESEVQALKRLSHPHIVKLVGSYTDVDYLGLIMDPVADMNLDEYLRSGHIPPHLRKRCVRSFFGCLAAALSYLHDKDVRHNDIKSSNVLIKDSCVYLADFGTSRSWGTEDSSSTLGEHEGFTWRYGAPELFDTNGRRNRASDIWSLGCVFLEMATVLLDRSLDELNYFLDHNGKLRWDAYWTNQEGAAAWIELLRGEMPNSDTKTLDWTTQMLQHCSDDRPTAGQIQAWTIEEKCQNMYICHNCALPNRSKSPDETPNMKDREATLELTRPTISGGSLTDRHLTEEPPLVTASALGIPERPARPLGEKGSRNKSVNTKASKPVKELPNLKTNAAELETRPHKVQIGTALEDKIKKLSAEAVADEPEKTNVNDDLIPLHPTKIQSRLSESMTITAAPGTPEEASTVSADTTEESISTASATTKSSGYDSLTSKSTTPELQSIWQPDKDNAIKRFERFEGLPEDRRPEPSIIADDEDADDEDENKDDEENTEDEFIYPEPIRPPPFLRKDPLPRATLVPSYILAGTNHFSRVEIESQHSVIQKNLFVYGRLMFPSVLRALAAQSSKGVYSRQLKRRVYPSSQDWSKADLSIKRASEIMTPARLKGYDRWRPSGLNCAVVQRFELTPKILYRGYDELPTTPPGYVDGFLILGIRSEALRYLDLIFAGNRRTIRSMRPQDDPDGDEDDSGLDSSTSDANLLSRKEVEVQVEAKTGELMRVHAETYTWNCGTEDLAQPWEEERFLRSSPMQALLRDQPRWMAEEQTLATVMKMSFVQVGDYLLGAITAGRVAELAALLNNYYDANAGCRVYGHPLQAAAALGHEDMVCLLLERRADINAPAGPTGQYGTPLIAATCASRKSITKLLLHHGADVFASDDVHVNALYQAVAHNDYAMAEMLLEHGAWLSRNWGEVLDLADELAEVEIQRLLQRYDVRKIHQQHKLLRQHGEEEDEVDVGGSSGERLISMAREEGRGWEMVRYSKVLMAVLRKCAAVQNVSGNWKGRRGVAVTVAALDAGAPLKLISTLRNSISPIKAIFDILKKGDEQQEKELNQAALAVTYGTGDLGPPRSLRRQRSPESRSLPVRRSCPERQCFAERRRSPERPLRPDSQNGVLTQARRSRAVSPNRAPVGNRISRYDEEKMGLAQVRDKRLSPSSPPPPYRYEEEKPRRRRVRFSD